MKQTKQFLRPLLMAIVMMVGMLVPKGAWAQSSPVTVGDEGFSTIQEAIYYIVYGDGGDATLTLHQDFTLEGDEGIDISFGPDSEDFNFTIDLNGHTITGGCDWNTNEIGFNNNGSGLPTVTIDNSCQDKKGKLFNCRLDLNQKTKVIVKEGVSLYPSFELIGSATSVFSIESETSSVENYGDIYGEVVNLSGGSFINNGRVAYVIGEFENYGSYCAYFNWADDGSSFRAYVYGSIYDYNEGDEDTSITSEVTKEPTCTEPGVRTVTGTVFYGDQEFTDTKEVEIPATGHDYQVQNVVWSEDNTSATLQLACECGKTADVEATVTYEVTMEPTCTEDGSRIVTASASYNDQTFTSFKPVTIPATGHSLDYPVWEWSDDDTSATLQMTCDACGQTVSFEATIITTVDENNAPTCAKDGSGTVMAIVESNGLSFSDSKSVTIPATGHSFESHILTEPDEHGLYAYICDYGCGTKHVILNEDDSTTANIELTVTTDSETGTTTYSAAATVAVPDGAFSTPVDFTATGDQVSIDRTFTAATPATINLPFDVPASAMSETYYTFGGIEQNTEGKWVATMNPVTGTLTANTPYIVLPSGTSISITDNTATVLFKADASANSSTTSGDWTMKAAKTPKTWAEGDQDLGKAYGFAAKAEGNISAGQFVKVGVGASIAAGRAYLQYNGEGTPTRAGELELPSTIEVRFVVGSTTGIGTIDTESGEFTFDGWYDLNGRRVSEPTKGGIYFNKNKKIIVK